MFCPRLLHRAIDCLTCCTDRLNDGGRRLIDGLDDDAAFAFCR